MYHSFSQEQENFFLSKPETGMGYQVIEASRHGSYTLNKYIILNSEIAIDFDNNYAQNIKKVVNDGVLSIKMFSQKIDFSQAGLKVFSEKEFRNVFKEPNLTSKGAAIESPKVQANGTDIFIRLSAFPDDKRIDAIKKCLRPGSFTTTKKDYDSCKSMNDDPVERYALPTDDKIKWAFFVTPKLGDILQKGEVQRAYGKRGGGEEAYFEYGTSINTYSPPAKPY